MDPALGLSFPVEKGENCLHVAVSRMNELLVFAVVERGGGNSYLPVDIHVFSLYMFFFTLCHRRKKLDSKKWWKED